MLVYSGKKKFLLHRNTKSLKALTNLMETSLASLTHLTVHLNVSSCESDGKGNSDCCVTHGYTMTYTCTKEYCRKHDQPLGMTSRDRAILLEWQRAARHIAVHIMPRRLDLYLVCDVEGLDLGHLAVQALRNFPVLKDCSIRLSKMPHPAIRALAVEEATRARGLQWPPEPTRAPFRLTDLPRELRLHILEYTDLVTPTGEVEWNPKDKFYIRYVERSCPPGYAEDWEEGSWAGPSCPPSRHHACKFRNCWEKEPQGDGCFCHRYHAGFSSNCRCWLPPKPLFLASRALRQDAESIFFAKNHFIIASAADCSEPANQSPETLEALNFFKNVLPSTARRYLRSLEIVFPPFHDDYLMPSEPAYRQLLQVIEQMTQLTLPTLNLSIVMADGKENGRVGRVQFRGTMTKAQARKVFSMYQRTIEPLSKLRELGLRALFLDLASPYTWDADRLALFDRDPWALLKSCERTHDQIKIFTRRAEKAVMGDGYDSELLQVKAHGQSLWLQQKIEHESSF